MVVVGEGRGGEGGEKSPWCEPGKGGGKI